MEKIFPHTPGKLEVVIPPSSCLTTRFIVGENGVHIAKVGHMDYTSGSQETDIGNTERLKACWNACIGIPTEDLEKGLKLTVDPIVRCGKQQGYKLVAEIEGAPGETEDDYHEMRVGIFDKDGKCVGDAFFTVDEETGEPKIYITTDGDGDGDPQITVFPLRPVLLRCEHTD